jgi:hypothetical protein
MGFTFTVQQVLGAKPCREMHGAYRLDERDPATVVSLGDVVTEGRRAGLSDETVAKAALWCLGCLPNTVETRLLAVRLVLSSVLEAAKHTGDERVHACNALLQRFADGENIPAQDLQAAAEAAREAQEARAVEAAARAAEATTWAVEAIWAAGAAEWAATWAAEAAGAAGWAAAWAAEAAARAARAAGAAVAAVWSALCAHILETCPPVKEEKGN